MLIEQPQAVNAVYHPPQPTPQPSVNPAYTPQEQIKTAPDTFSSEPNMHINAGDEKLVKVTVMLDQESLQIIQEASAVHSESIVNLGIKLFAKTNVYKEFMLKESNKPMDVKTEDIASQVEAKADVVPTPTSSAPTSSSEIPASTGTAGGFTSW